MSRILLITGAARGIGAATARLAARRGYRLALNYRADDAAAETLRRTLTDAGCEARLYRADVGDEAAVEAMFAAIDADLGPLDALVNNAGMLEPQSDLADMDAARWRRVLDTNLVGSFLCAREAVRRMSTANGGKGGAIVNVSSRAADLGAAHEYVDYAAAKGGVDAMTIGLAKEVAAQGIRVNAVKPGLIHTDMHASGGEPGRIERLQSAVPMLRGGSADEVAEAILWLLSDAASYTTGSFVDVSGGR